MSGQRRLRSTMIGRVAVGLLAGAAMLLLSPVASATPESDADAAITAAWDANGGDTGSLGARDGGVYPAGEGFGQNFAGGKIFFTPAVGAHIMKGAILEKYESLGGPANSDLGFPTIDEGAGRAPGSLNTTFSAADKPVIFWTPETGARVVRGPINAAWDKLGGSAGRLGVPAEDEAYRGDVVAQKFTGGEISYDPHAKTFTTVPPELAGELQGLQVPDDPASAINAARRAAGGPLGPLGAADGPPYPIGGDGLGQNFAGGKIFYSPQTGANVVTGQVLAKYESVGGPEGDLGFPTSNDVDGGLAPTSRIITFAAEDKPVIFWTPDYGAVIVRGAMNAAWEKLGGAKGELGAPMADQSENGSVTTQRFGGGVISWDSSSNKFTTEPANLASELSDLQVPGQQAPQTPSGQASDTNGGNGFQWHWWWWLLAAIPVLVLVGLVGFAALRNRRGSEDDDRFDSGLADEIPEYSGAPAVDHAGNGDHTAEPFGDDYAPAGLGSLSAATATSGQRTYPDAPISLWGSPAPVDEATEAHSISAQTEEQDEDDDPDSVDTAPTRLPTAVERDPLTDTGRHARIEINEPEPSRTALRLALDDPDEMPEGYPVKADTKSGLYWAPGSALYDDARAEIWFASEEFARANGFVRGDEFNS